MPEWALTQREAEISTSNVVAGYISIAHTSAYTLLNFRALYSFISTSFIKKWDIVPELLDEVYNISLPYRENLTSRFSFKAKSIKIVGRELLIKLIVLEMGDYNVILGMDWLSKHNDTIFYKKKSVVFQPSEKKLLSIRTHLEEPSGQ